MECRNVPTSNIFRDSDRFPIEIPLKSKVEATGTSLTTSFQADALFAYLLRSVKDKKEIPLKWTEVLAFRITSYLGNCKLYLATRETGSSHFHPKRSRRYVCSFWHSSLPLFFPFLSGVNIETPEIFQILLTFRGTKWKNPGERLKCGLSDMRNEIRQDASKAQEQKFSRQNLSIMRRFIYRLA